MATALKILLSEIGLDYLHIRVHIISRYVYDFGFSFAGQLNDSELSFIANECQTLFAIYFIYLFYFLSHSLQNFAFEDLHFLS